LAGIDTRLLVGERYHAKWDPSRRSLQRLFIAVAPHALCLNITDLKWQ